MRRLPKRVDDDALRKMWYSRLPDKIVALRLGHGRGTLRRRAMRLGFPRRRVIWNGELDSVREAAYECVP